jgi:hypothetical protein
MTILSLGTWRGKRARKFFFLTRLLLLLLDARSQFDLIWIIRVGRAPRKKKSADDRGGNQDSLHVRDDAVRQPDFNHKPQSSSDSDYKCVLESSIMGPFNPLPSMPDRDGVCGRSRGSGCHPPPHPPRIARLRRARDTGATRQLRFAESSLVEVMTWKTHPLLCPSRDIFEAFEPSPRDDRDV